MDAPSWSSTMAAPIDASNNVSGKLPMNKIVMLDARALAAAIRTREVSCVEVMFA